MTNPREDRVVFYAVAVSSFLETSVPLYTRELRTMFAGDPAAMPSPSCGGSFAAAARRRSRMRARRCAT